MANISQKQKKVLDFLRQYTKENGYSPSVRDICDGLGFSSTSTVHGYLCRLEEKGFIRRDSFRPRTIEIVEDAAAIRQMVALPVVGSVAAGVPIFAEENIQDVYHLPSWFVRAQEGESFILNVVGESMVNAGILHGDQIIVQRVSTAENGEIVVVLIEEEATVKRYYRENGYIRLHPENDFMEDIIIQSFQSASIVGRVIGLMRQYQ
ncbi:transcriptional repressor LexA [Eubacteriales bacterium OttesenSCG-928-M02]|nr:transcriptional repressor LexA [Eubacteriales bacterium OttesenSCG-928-M02]